MRTLGLCTCALILLICSGCTEMRIEGDAKVFQTSATGYMLGAVLGLVLVIVGLASVIGSLIPNRKPQRQQNWNVQPEEGLTSKQKISLAIFGLGAFFAGFFLMIICLLIPNKLHVTVYPDRVALASTFSQTNGREVVVPFDTLASVELKDDLNVVGKLRTYLVLTPFDGKAIQHLAGNNERQAFETIQQTLAEYRTKHPANARDVTAARNPAPQKSSTPAESSPRSGPSVGEVSEHPAKVQARLQQPAESGAATSSQSAARTGYPATPGMPSLPSTYSGATVPSSASAGSAAPTGKSYTLKRYPINIAVQPGHKLVEPDTIVAVASKLSACYADGWYSLTVVAINDDGTITCNWDDFPAFTYKMVREDLVISTSQTPVVSARPQTASKYSLKRYKITISLPRGLSLVKPSTVVNPGMKLKACYAGHWESVTVVETNEDGTITCNWDNWKGFTYRMVREDLVIQNP